MGKIIRELIFCSIQTIMNLPLIRKLLTNIITLLISLSHLASWFHGVRALMVIACMAGAGSIVGIIMLGMKKIKPRIAALLLVKAGKK